MNAIDHYITGITKLLSQTEDIVLLDMIYKLLSKN